MVTSSVLEQITTARNAIVLATIRADGSVVLPRCILALSFKPLSMRLSLHLRLVTTPMAALRSRGLDAVLPWLTSPNNAHNRQ